MKLQAEVNMGKTQLNCRNKAEIVLLTSFTCAENRPEVSGKLQIDDAV